MNQVYLLFILILFTACVGTVQNTKVPNNNLFQDNQNTLKFIGIEQARAIAHDKIEVEFTPITSTDPDLKYHLFVNGDNATPIEIDPSALDNAPGGKLRYVLKDLNINVSYKLRMRLYNTKTNQYSSGESEFTIRTFDSRTADFTGISTVSKVPGQSSSSIKVTWLPAKFEGLILPEDYDPYYYEITYASASGPANLVNHKYVGADKIKEPVPPKDGGMILKNDHPTFAYVHSLLPNTTYYVNVRAVNKLYATFEQQGIFPIPVDKELNTKFLTIKTDPATGAFDMNRDGLTLYNAPGKDALTKINAFWTPATGVFQEYHVYFDKYTGSDDPAADDRLTSAHMVNMFNSGIAERPMKLKTDVLSATAKSLDPYNWYQFKVVACLDKNNCSPADTNASNRAITFMKTIRTEPALAQFSGIVKAESPRNITDLNNKSITLTWDKISLESGYAEELEVYCVDPTTANSATPSYRKLTTTPVSGGVNGCSNVALLSAVDHLTHTSAKIVGLNVGQKYCFAMSPVINDPRHPVAKRRIPPSLWVYRCITPEVRTPTVSDFPGFNLTCAINQDTATFNWKTPTSGIYQEYVLFSKDLSKDNGPFRYTDAIATADLPNSPYSKTVIPSGTLTKVLTNLEPGTRYRFGMLTRASMGTTDYYSEYNVNIVECAIPMPIATFNEWTRLFAIGPKADGRVPLENNTRNYLPEGLLLEALNQDGIPVELGNTSDPFFLPPGNYFGVSSPPAGFGNQPFDGAHGRHANTFVMASSSGIVSLAWIDVKLDFRESTFQTSQNGGVRGDRKFGYKVYRSDDNRVTWKDLTKRSDGAASSGLIHARNYNYKFLSNAATPITKRMAFFTDYSANIQKDVDFESTERGRIFWYKIVPVYNDKELKYEDSSYNPHHIVKVILPPSNMALVHRKMANRTACNEIGRQPDYSENYRCDYVGVGAVAKDFPWRQGETVLDQGGDLLVDRYELSCQYTRGDTDQSNTRESYSYFPYNYDEPSLRGSYRSQLPNFEGFALNHPDFSKNTGKIFKGCTGRDIPQSPDDEGYTYPDITINKYKTIVSGDCLGSGGLGLTTNYCEDWPDPGVLHFPGASGRLISDVGTIESNNYAGNYCTTSVDPNAPYFVNGSHNGVPGLFNEVWIDHIVDQSEYMAVFAKRTPGDSEALTPQYKTPTGTIKGDRSSCMINLASIGSDGKWHARWQGLEQLSSKADMTVSQVHGSSGLGIWGEGYAIPNESMWNKRRFSGNTKLSRIMTSNAAKLPPLRNITPASAERICNTLDVQIGYYDNSTGIFSPQTMKLKKKLMVRKDQVAAAAWPESENYTEALITDLEAGVSAGNGYCATSSSTSGPAEGVFPGNLFTPRMAAEGSGSSIIHTGSSAADNSSVESGLCISKYGIQDLAGNVRELTPHRLFCDYSKDALYVGGETSPGNNIYTPNTSALAPENIIPQYFPAGEPIYDATKVPTGRIDPPPGGFNTWASIDPESGYCSIIDSVELRSKVESQPYFVEAGEFLDIFKLDGSLDTNMVLSPNTIDQKSVNTMRDGSGYFLNFGAKNLSPRLGRTNGLALRSGSTVSSAATYGVGKFFSPILGLPLSCGDSHFCSSGQRVAGEDVNDNKLITTSYFDSKVPSIESKIKNFPTHNSQINHVGISEYTSNVMYVDYDGDPSSVAPGGFTNIYDPMTIVDPTTRRVAGTKKTMHQFLNGKPAGTYKFVTTSFLITRNSVMLMSSGGSAKDTGSGRYAMTIEPEGYTTSGYTAGFRCSVLIKDE